MSERAVAVSEDVKGMVEEMNRLLGWMSFAAQGTSRSCEGQAASLTQHWHKVRALLQSTAEALAVAHARLEVNRYPPDSSGCSPDGIACRDEKISRLQSELSARTAAGEELIVAIKGWAHDGRLQTFEDRERFRKWARALTPSGVQEHTDWVRVPREPTKEMMEAWYRGYEAAQINAPNDFTPFFTVAYKAMLAVLLSQCSAPESTSKSNEQSAAPPEPLPGGTKPD